MSVSGDVVVVNARARGLALHLFSRAEIEELAGATLAELAETLSRRLAEPRAVPPTPEGLHSMIRHGVMRAVRLLSRWPGSQPAVEIFEAEQDRRALRAMLRGAVQAAPRQHRLDGLLATSSLPERALVDLAEQPTARLVVAHLVALQHPAALRLSVLVARGEPDLFDVDVELVRGFAHRASRAAERGDRHLRAFVGRRIDLSNAELALALAGGLHERDPARCFVDGGACFGRDAFVLVSRADTKAMGASSLRRLVAGTPLDDVASEAGESPARLERAGLVHELAVQRRESRLDPLGSAPLLSYVLRLEAEAIDLSRLVWAAALGAPAKAVLSELVTPWR